MNLWMSEPFTYPDRPMDRGKVLHEQDLEKLGSFARYKDVDGDGIPYRTIPGNKHPLAAWFARGTGHDENADYSERPEVWEANMARIWRKLETARQVVPPPEVDQVAGAEVGIIAYGTTDPAVREARDHMRRAGLETSYLRLRALPFSPRVEEFIRSHQRLYVVEMNDLGQMRQLLQLEVPDQATKLISVLRNNGLPLSAQWVAERILAAEEE